VTARRTLAIAAAAAALGAWCGWASGFHRSTTPATVTWGISLSAVVLVDVLLWRGRRGLHPGWPVEARGRPWPRPGRRGGATVQQGLWPWLALTVVVVAWEVLGIDTGGQQAHLTISALSQAFRGLHAAVLAIWILVGWGYGWARSRVPARPATVGRKAGRDGKPSAAVVLLHTPASWPALLLPSNRPSEWASGSGWSWPEPSSIWRLATPGVGGRRPRSWSGSSPRRSSPMSSSWRRGCLPAITSLPAEVVG
jgi:hypothetical protein